ncbi:MAG: lysylphosphatidylglycerol synthase transmembrane domain-containing protein [Bacteroidota bacterium]
MTKKLLNIAKIAFFIGLGILLVWIVLQNLTDKDIEEIKIAFYEANYWWIGVSILVGAISHLFRAMRWKLLLQTMQHKPSLANTFFSVMVGYLANTAVPRLGEVSRCGVLTRYEKIPFEESFGTVVAERLIDTLTFFLLFLFIVWYQFDKIFGYANQKVFSPLLAKFPFLIKPTFWILIAIVGVLGITILYFLNKRKKKNQDKKQSKLANLLTGFAKGLVTVKTVKQPFLFWTYSVAIWFFYFLNMLLSFYAFEQTSVLSPSVALACMTFGTFAFIAVQGGIGAYPLIVMEVLGLFGVASSVGYAFGWVAWCASTLVILLLGFLSLLLLPLVNKKVN